MSSDTSDYKNDRFIFTLECPLSLPKACHFVMGEVREEVGPRQQVQSGRQRECLEMQGPDFTFPYGVFCIFMPSQQSHRSKQPLKQPVEMWSPWLFALCVYPD